MGKIKVLRNLFEEMNKNKLDYFILTNFFNLNKNGDIDLFVSKENKKQFLAILNEQNWLKRTEPSNYNFRDFYYFFDNNEVIYLDVKFELLFMDKKNKMFFPKKSVDEILLNTSLNCDFARVPQPTDSIELYLAHIFYEKQKVEQRHLEELLSLLKYSSEKKIIDEKLNEYYEVYEKMKDGKDVDLKKWLLEKKDYSPFQKKDNYGFGYKVIILGTDGTGKTTLIKNIKKNLPVKMKSLYLGTGDEGWEISAISALNRNIKGNVGKLIFRSSVLPFELLLRVLKGRRNAKYRLVLIDRIPGWSKMSNSKIVKIIYNNILPEPDLIILLTGDSDVLFKRKGEKDISRIEEDNIKFKKIANMFDCGVVEIDTTRNGEVEAERIAIDAIINESAFKNRLFERI